MYRFGRALLSVFLLIAPAPRPAASGQVADGLGLLQWRFTTGGPVRATPLACGAMLYVGSTDGSLYALHASSGAMAWRATIGSPIVGPAACDAERIYVQDRFSAVHALERAAGGRLWKMEAGPDQPLPWGYEGWDYTGPGPVLADGLLYASAGDGVLRALEPASGVERWRFETGGRLRAAATVIDGGVYFGSGDGVFRKLDAATGRLLWRFATDGASLDSAAAGFDRRQIYSRAAVAGGQVYFGSRDANVYALDAATGELAWKSDDGTSAWVVAGPTVHGDRLLVTRSSSTRVRALSRSDGSEIWNVVSGGAVFSPSVVLGDDVLVANGSGLVLALDAESGAARWRYGLGSAVWATPVVSAGRLFVGADDGMVYAFGLAARRTPETAVFWDEQRVGESAFGAQPTHAAVRQYFERRGYQPVDSDGLADFMRRQVASASASVVVFAMDALPPAIGADDGTLLREYLRAGGRAVWLGLPPELLVRDSAGNVTGIDRDRPAALLGLDHTPYNSDLYGVWPTEAGRQRGLRSWWTAGPTVAPDTATVVLARDELGRAVAWEQSYGGPEGSGFVYLYPSIDRSRLDEIRAVAEYGIFRSPAILESAAR